MVNARYHTQIVGVNPLAHREMGELSPNGRLVLQMIDFLAEHYGRLRHTIVPAAFEAFSKQGQRDQGEIRELVADGLHDLSNKGYLVYDDKCYVATDRLCDRYIRTGLI
jgi:hypothetical protein